MLCKRLANQVLYNVIIVEEALINKQQKGIYHIVLKNQRFLLNNHKKGDDNSKRFIYKQLYHYKFSNKARNSFSSIKPSLLSSQDINISYQALLSI